MIAGYFILSIINGGNDLLLTATVPEPSSLSLLLLGGVFVQMVFVQMVFVQMVFVQMRRRRRMKQ